MLYAILIAILLVADQWVKYWATVNVILDTGEYAFIPGFIKIVNVHNSGAAFGFMESSPSMRWIFAGLAIAITVVIIIVMLRRVFPGKFPMLLCSLAIAGALGNCIDRFIYGYVVDMFKLEFMNFAIFNVADVLLTVSCILFIIYLLFGYRDNSSEEEDDEEGEKEHYRKAPVSDDDDIGLAELKSTDVEEAAPAKHVSIDNAFWGTENEPVGKEARVVSPAKEKKPSQPPKEKPVDDDEFSLEAIMREFK